MCTGPKVGKRLVAIASTPGVCCFAISEYPGVKPWRRISAEAHKWWSTASANGSPPYVSRMWGHFQYNEGVLSLPYWFVIAMSAALATVPWLRWRFTLRTLLIATTLVAVMLGLIVWSAS
jgi:hypothetical protein